MVRFVLGSRQSGTARASFRARPVALVAAAIGLTCLTLPQGAAAEAAAGPADPAVTVADGRLSVRVGEAPLDEVLEAIAAQSDVAIVVRGDAGIVGPQEFADRPLEVGIRRLAGERRLLMVFAPPDDLGEAGRLREVRIYGDVPSDDPTRSGRPLTRTLGRLTQERAPAPAPPAPEPPGYKELAAEGKGERLAAIRALARRQDDAAIEVLGALLARDPDGTVRRIAATALGNIGGEVAAAALEPALADSDVEVRVQAMRGLHVINGEAAAASLGELALGDADPALRRQAVHLLATLRGDEARSAIELAATDPDDTVRQAAEQALTRPRGWR